MKQQTMPSFQGLDKQQRRTLFRLMKKRRPELTRPMFYQLMKACDMGDALGDMSQRTGVSVEALSELQYAAQLSGTNLQTLERGFMGMARFMEQARDGSASAADDLAQMGLSAAQLQGLHPDEQLLKIATGLSKIKDDSARAALAMKIFGKAGFELGPFLSQGAAGIEQLRAEAQALGVTMSSESAEAAGKFNDALDRLNMIFDTLKRQVGEALLPVLANLLEDFAAGIMVIKETVTSNEALGSAVKFVGESMENMMSPLELWLREWYALASIFRVVQSAITKVGAALAKVIHLAAGSGLAERIFGDSAKNVAAISGAIAEDLDKLAAEQFDKASENFNMAFSNDLSKQMEEARNKLKAMQTKVKETQRELQAEIPKVSQELRDSANSIGDAASNLKDTAVSLASPENLDASSTAAFSQFQQNKREEETRQLKKTLDILTRALTNPSISIAVIGE